MFFNLPIFSKFAQKLSKVSRNIFLHVMKFIFDLENQSLWYKDSWCKFQIRFYFSLVFNIPKSTSEPILSIPRYYELIFRTKSIQTLFGPSFQTESIQLHSNQLFKPSQSGSIRMSWNRINLNPIQTNFLRPWTNQYSWLNQ